VVGIHAIGGMAGVGKTAFAVHAAHQLAGTFPDGQFFLPLHAHTPGQRPVDPTDALASLLLTAGAAASLIPPGLDARAARWRDQVAGKKILLVLDDAAGHQQVRPLLPGTAGSLVLITSRRRLIALDDTAVISLDILPPGEAAILLARLAGRPGLRAEDAAADEITRLCGYLPLAIGMLASQLRHHPNWTASQLAADLANARDRLAVLRAENLSVAAAFDLSYQDLTEVQQRVFRRLGLIPGPTFDACAAAALGNTSLDQARRHLDELYDQHLLTEPAPGRYRLHDLLREHAHTLAAADDPADRGTATGRLLDYYLHTAIAAGQYLPVLTAAARRPPPGQRPADAAGLSTLGQAVAWLQAERPNLHAAVHYAAASGRPLHAIHIAAAIRDFLRAHTPWDEAAALHEIALAAACQGGNVADQAGVLDELGFLSYLTANFPAATARFAQAVRLFGEAGDRPDQATALSHLGDVQYTTGDYPAAIASLEQALALARSTGERATEASSLIHLGCVQQLAGDYKSATASLELALTLCRSLGHRHGEAVALNFLGTVQTRTGDYPAATANIRQALEIFSDLDDRTLQAEALNDLGMAQQLTGDYPAAAASHQRALEMFRELGSPLGQAEALNNLGELSSRTSATRQARSHHTKALAIARSIGVPLEEARALEGLGQSCLQGGSPSEATAHLEQALAIYKRIGTPGVRRVQETLRQHGLHRDTASGMAGMPPAPELPSADRDSAKLGCAFRSYPDAPSPHQ
jgi:tetratricopeptide (TPR) repeat protein